MQKPPRQKAREWIKLKSLSDPNISILSYNVLAASLVRDAFHGHCPTKHLVWETRSNKMIQKIVSAGPDIFCLQELDHFHLDHFQETFEAEYDVLYKQRTGSEHQDGCALFFKRERFHLLEHSFIEYGAHNPICKGNVAILVLLKCKISEHCFVVANTHILFSPKSGYAKLLQIHTLMRQVQELCDRHVHAAIPVIVAGDFNMLPKSFLHKYIEGGEVCPLEVNESVMSGMCSIHFMNKNRLKDIDQSHTLDRLQAIFQEHLETEKFLLTHSLTLKSVYSYLNPLDGHPIVSTFHGGTFSHYPHYDGIRRPLELRIFGKAAVDFIFVGHSKIRDSNHPKWTFEPAQYLALPRVKSVRKMPHAFEPSDHYHLECAVQIKEIV